MSLKQLNLLSATFIITRPLLEYVICPKIKQITDNHAINNFCNIVTEVIKIAPITIGTISIGTAICYAPQGFLLQNYPILLRKLLPTSLALFATQGIIKEHDVPTSVFWIGLLKASIVILSTNAVTVNVGATVAFEKFAIAISTTSTLNIASFITNEIMNDDLDYSDLSKASDYAIGFSVARGMTQIAMYSDNRLISSSLFFAAPIARGLALGLIGQGSVLIPGSNTGVIDNIIDGVAIATAAFVSDNILSPTITSALCTAAVIAYKNQDFIQDMLGVSSEHNVKDNEL